MAKASAHARASVTQISAGWLRWSSTDGYVLFEIRLELVDQLTQVSAGGFGLLLGTIESSTAGSHRIRVVGCRKTGAGASETSAARAVIGICARQQASTIQELTETLREHSGLRSGVGLLMRIDPQGEVAVMLWGADTELLEPLLLRFPASTAQLARSAYAPFRLLASAQPAEFIPTERRRVGPWVVAAAVGPALLLLAGAGIWYTTTAMRSTPSAAVSAVAVSNADLGLHIARSGSAIEIRWNRDAAAIRDARTGALEITDNGQRRELALSDLELRSGHTVYEPQSGDVQLVLNVDGPSGNARESVRFIGSFVPGSTMRSRSWDPAALIVPPTTPAAPPRIFTPAEKAVPVVRPQLTEAAQASVPPPVSLPQGAQPQKLVLPPPPVTQPAPEAPQRTEPRPETQQPARSAAVRRNVEAIPPAPTKQVMPELSPQLRRLILADTTVEVRVNVGPNGEVTDAVVADTNGVGSHLARVSRDAAMRWRFQPARLNGQAVQGSYTLRFRFAASRR